jgi:murein DD-endopeptidase MepM/ murein hydrolase activator NlpD
LFHSSLGQSARVKRIALHAVGTEFPTPEIPVTAPLPTAVVHVPKPEQQAVCMPLASYRITSGFGRRRHPITGRSDFHSGIDLAAYAQVVRNIMDGTVQATGYDRNLGNYVRIEHGEIQSVYGHLSRISVEPGQAVAAGYPIGVTGSTGRATGEHLHFAIRRNGIYINPWELLQRMMQHIDNKH